MKKISGFTTVELMITLAIIGIALAIGVPSLKEFRQNNQLIASTNDLISAFHVARSEAIKLNSRVSICESSNGTSCSNSGDWKDGWIVFVDANGNLSGTGEVCEAVNTDCLLRVHEGFTGNELSAIGQDGGGVAIRAYTFTSRGLPKDINGISQQGIFNLCSLDETGSTTNSRAVILGLSGRVRVSDDTSVITQCPP